MQLQGKIPFVLSNKNHWPRSCKLPANLCRIHPRNNVSINGSLQYRNQCISCCNTPRTLHCRAVGHQETFPKILRFNSIWFLEKQVPKQTVKSWSWKQNSTDSCTSRCWRKHQDFEFAHSLRVPQLSFCFLWQCFPGSTFEHKTFIVSLLCGNGHVWSMYREANIETAGSVRFKNLQISSFCALGVLTFLLNAPLISAKNRAIQMQNMQNRLRIGMGPTLIFCSTKNVEGVWTEPGDGLGYQKIQSTWKPVGEAQKSNFRPWAFDSSLCKSRRTHEHDFPRRCRVSKMFPQTSYFLKIPGILMTWNLMWMVIDQHQQQPKDSIFLAEHGCMWPESCGTTETITQYSFPQTVFTHLSGGGTAGWCLTPSWLKAGEQNPPHWKEKSTSWKAISLVNTETWIDLPFRFLCYFLFIFFVWRFERRLCCAAREVLSALHDCVYEQILPIHWRIDQFFECDKSFHLHVQFVVSPDWSFCCKTPDKLSGHQTISLISSPARERDASGQTNTFGFTVGWWTKIDEPGKSSRSLTDTFVSIANLVAFLKIPKAALALKLQIGLIPLSNRKHPQQLTRNRTKSHPVWHAPWKQLTLPKASTISLSQFHIWIWKQQMRLRPNLLSSTTSPAEQRLDAGKPFAVFVHVEIK